MYTLGQTYIGNAVNNTRPSWTKGMTFGARYKHRRVTPAWVKGVKGCFLWFRDIRASEKHPPPEVTVAVKLLNDKHPSPLINISDL